ncbi:3-hydroxyacyl-CoA dehydrogenase [Pandoraea terrae]|uniref:enoyl-CoA hydratase n=2 Tax=Pandoraea terrae TaxID=1537710 RepID=A0A5E4U5C2_9BURK|nr:3-hydroxyacyl-CoA dehydrogenase [Pandoraea terrae]
MRLQRLDGGIIELVFDRQGDAINKLDATTIRELGEATRIIAAAAGVAGLLVSSAKDAFVVGADITEFGETFRLPMPELAAHVARSNLVLTAFEDLDVPSVMAINGYALGGGLELALSGSIRVMSDTARIGLPEVSLGLLPGLGGTSRLPRVAGAAVALDWITGGKPSGAQAALEAGVADRTSPPQALRETALAVLGDAIAGRIDWRAAQQRKRRPLTMESTERKALFDTALAKVRKASPKHQPAAAAAVQLLAEAATLDRAGALHAEAQAFANIAKTQAAGALVQTFLSGQSVKKLVKQHARTARPVKQLAVLGAGIMGGGIAYTSALGGTPVLLKDIAQEQLELGIGEAGKLLAKQVRNGRKTQEQADAILASIHPQLDEAGFDAAELVIEAVVENIGVKRKVLSDLETKIRADAVIASNTSSLLIDDIARGLARPENFVGMHFFNPVPAMPLVEIVRGSRSTDAAVSTAVTFAAAMGKTPIVVKDCPGFLVNRLLAAYVRAFLKLLADGADFECIDRVMEDFGWPMGPAYLQDVIGMDTGCHAVEIVFGGYPERMPPLDDNALKLMVRHRRLGQKNGIGFYRYDAAHGSKPRRSAAPDTHDLLAQLSGGRRIELTDAEIVERMMLPMLIEAAHALEDGVVATPAELDMALLLGVGFPTYLGGILKYADSLGLRQIVGRADALAAFGPAYVPTAGMRDMAARGATYY